MTSAAVTTPSENRYDSESCLDALEQHLDPNWRTTEWNDQRQLFTGDPDNPNTKAFVCPVANCVSATEVVNALCTACYAALRRSGLGRAAWENSYVPGYRRSPHVDPASLRVAELPSWARATAGTLGRNQFSLEGLHPVVRAEILIGLQQRDREQVILAPANVRRLIRRLPANLSSVLELDEQQVAAVPPVLAGLLRGIQLHVRRLEGIHRGLDFTEGDVWNSVLVGLRAAPSRNYVAAFGTIDFQPIRQTWLRELIKQHARSVRPSVSEVGRIIGSAAMASTVLAGRPHGNEPSQLNLADMSAIVDAFRTSTNTDGTAHSHSHRISLLGHWRRTLEYCRATGLMDDIPGTFSINPQHHRIVRHQAAEDLLGRAIPEPVIAQLDNHVHLIKTLSSYHQGGWTGEDFGEMYSVIYQLLRDTGRRPNEIVSLRRTCLEWVDGHPTLVWDNHKRRRMGRRLPIHADTARIIEAWLKRRDALPPTPGAEEWMFPTPGARNRPRHGHVSTSQFISKVFRTWIDSIPELWDVGLTPEGEVRHVERAAITPYGLRHAYAQRHADNGTPVDVLRELMDHRSVETTMGYYTVTVSRKRKAIEAVAKYAVDRHGNPAPRTDAVAYQRESVSVPFGNCTEPSNIKAGGKHCPIRYQCSGCSFYRPDPSYLQAIEAHVTSLRADRETASATDAATWVVDNFQDQIDAFTKVATAMRESLVDLTPAQRVTIQDAAQVLRRDRAATSTFLPIGALYARTDRDAL